MKPDFATTAARLHPAVQNASGTDQPTEPLFDSAGKRAVRRRSRNLSQSDPHEARESARTPQADRVRHMS
jgi:hypothetical protein